MKKSNTITRTVWILSLVSLFTDIASEMLYPVMPVYLKEIGFTVLLIGILEGFAEAVAGLSKSYFGKVSDQSGQRIPFIRVGYLMSALSKPMMAFFTFPIWIFITRTTDRFGKGIRTGARDALLSDEATPKTKGTVFGLHRAMDTLGAVLGPSLALLFLHFFPSEYKLLFLLAFIPGMLAISFTWFIRKKEVPSTISPSSVSPFAFLNYWKESSVAYKKLVTGLLAFALINSSDFFLLLKIKDSGVGDTVVIGVYIFYNLVYALAAFPVGRLSDRMGFKKTFLSGLFLFATVYLGMALSDHVILFGILFVIYGIYAAATESVSKAWISNLAEKKDTATAIGTYTGLQSIATLISSSVAGLIWFSFGATAMLIITGTITFIIIIYLYMQTTESPVNRT
jgi:MFS family permease